MPWEGEEDRAGQVDNPIDRSEGGIKGAETAADGQFPLLPSLGTIQLSSSPVTEAELGGTAL